MSFSSSSKLLFNGSSEDTDDSVLPQDLLECLKNYFFSDNPKQDGLDDYDELLMNENKSDNDLILAIFDSENTIDKILIAISMLFSFKNLLC